MPCFNSFTRFYDETEDEDIEQQQQQSPNEDPIQVNQNAQRYVRNTLITIGIILLIPLGIAVLSVPGFIGYYATPFVKYVAIFEPAEQIFWLAVLFWCAVLSIPAVLAPIIFFITHC